MHINICFFKIMVIMKAMSLITKINEIRLICFCIKQKNVAEKEGSILQIKILIIKVDNYSD